MPDERILDLNLEDLAPLGRQVKVGEHLYDLRHPESLGLVEYARLNGLEKRMTEAARRVQENPAAEDAAAEAEAAITGLVHLVLPDLPAEELAKVPYLKKQKIYAFFNGRLANLEASLKRAVGLPTTPISSPDSPSGTESLTEIS